MPDFEPVFRDGIGYCNALCRCAWDTEQEDRVIRFCGHHCSPSAPPARNDTVCVPWVRSLLKAETPRQRHGAELPPVPDEAADVTPEAEKAFFEKVRSFGHGPAWTPGECKLSPNPFIGDEKVREAIKWLETMQDCHPKEFASQHSRTLIDAYRAERRKRERLHARMSRTLQSTMVKGWLDKINQKGRTPMKGSGIFVDKIIYVQEWEQESSSKSCWYVWEDSAESGKVPKPPSPANPFPDRHAAIIAAHDLATIVGSPGHGVRELETKELKQPRFESQKGTPMSTDNVIYVQRRKCQKSEAHWWYAWKDSASNKSPMPGGTWVAAHKQATRPEALTMAHDMASELGIPNVQELPREAPDKTQAQRDAELLRAIVSRLLDGHAVYCKDAERLNEIADRLEST